MLLKLGATFIGYSLSYALIAWSPSPVPANDCEDPPDCKRTVSISGDWTATPGNDNRHGSCKCNEEQDCLTKHCKYKVLAGPSGAIFTHGSHKLLPGGTCSTSATHSVNLSVTICGGSDKVEWEVYDPATDCTGASVTWKYEIKCDATQCGDRACP